MKKIFLMLMIGFIMLTFSSSAWAEREAIVSKMKGVVEVKIGEADWQPAVVGMVLHMNDEVRTGQKSYLELLLDQKGATGRLEIKEKTRMRLNTLTIDEVSGDKTTLLDVAIGRVMVHVQKLKGSSKFEVRTPTSTMGVRGTVFEVVVDEDSMEK